MKKIILILAIFLLSGCNLYPKNENIKLEKNISSEVVVKKDGRIQGFIKNGDTLEYYGDCNKGGCPEKEIISKGKNIKVFSSSVAKDEFFCMLKFFDDDFLGTTNINF